MLLHLSITRKASAAIKREQYRRLQADIARAEHELAIARASGLGAADPEFQALEAAIENARKVM